MLRIVIGFVLTAIYTQTSIAVPQLQTAVSGSPFQQSYLNTDNFLPVTELIILDESVPDRSHFYQNKKANVDIYEINKNSNSLLQLQNILIKYQHLDALHIVSHANNGQLLLGGQLITKKRLLQHNTLFNVLDSALNENADLLFYGCDLAQSEKGKSFVNVFAEKTHLDVAASTNLTGHSKLGGDWLLDYQLGKIETQHPFDNVKLQQYMHVLTTVDFTGIGAVDSGGTGFKVLTNTDLIVSNEFLQEGSTEMYWGTQVATAVMIIKADNDDTASFDVSELNVWGFSNSTPGVGASSTLVFRDKDNTIIRTMTLNNATSIPAENSGTITNLFNIFDNNTSLPVEGVASITFNYNSSNAEANNITFKDITITNTVAPSTQDFDGNLTSSSTLIEPIDIPSTVDDASEAVDVFDFTITDGGASDGLSLDITQVVIDVSGTATDTLRDDATWRLNGPDVINDVGFYNASTDTLTFSGLNISVADATSEIYTVNAFMNTSNAVTDNATFILTIDGDVDLTVASSGTQMTSTIQVSNGFGGVFEVDAETLAFTEQAPRGSTSGVAFTTQPVANAIDAFGNIDLDFTETVTISTFESLNETNFGVLTNATATAVAGVATFSGLTFTATEDQQEFSLGVTDDADVGSDLPISYTNTVKSDVVATQLRFNTQPFPLSINNASTTSFSTVPVVNAVDANNVVDTGYSTTITLTEVNGAGAATMSATGDTDGTVASVSVSPSAGIANFTDMQVTYTASGSTSEAFNLQASSGVLPTVNSSQLTGVVNSAPVISGTPAATVAQDAIYSFTPVVTDADVGDTTTFSINTTPSWATFSSSTGTLTGTPTNSDIGTTSNIVITVTDSGSATDSLAAFSLEVTNVNDAPVITGTPITSFNEGVAYTFAPVGSDVDAGDDIAFSIANKPTWATFISGTGVLSGTPTNSDVGITENIVITVTDTAGLTASLAAFSLTVRNVNDAPVITGTPSTAVAQDAIYSFTPTVTDADASDTTTFSINTTPSWATFSSSTGTLTGTPTNSDIGTTSNIVITVTDSGSATDSLAAFSLEVTNVNDAPVITGTPITSFNEGVAYTFAPVGSDVDAGDDIAFSIANKPTWATFISGTGVLSGTPTNSDVGITENIVITVTDTAGLTASLAAFSLTVRNVNDAPVITGTPSTAVAQDAIYSFTPTVTDADASDTTTFSINTTPSWATFSSSTGTLTGTPTNSDIGTTSNIVITVTDSGSATDSLAAFSLEVTNVNDAPVITGTPITSFNEGVAYTFAPVGSDVDAGDDIAFSIANKPTWATFISATGVLSGTPTNSDVGITENIVITVTDTGGLKASLAAFSLTVVNVNDAPVISGTPITSVNEGVAYTFAPVASDSDAGDTTTFSIMNIPTWATFSSSTGVLTGTPTNSDVGVTSNIVITVTDTAGLTASLAAFSLTVANVNDAPVITGTPITSVNEGVAYTFAPVASDSDAGDTTTFSINTTPSWATFSSSTGVLTGTPTNSDVGVTSNIVITVTDTAGLTASLAAFSLTVANVNDAPVITGTPITSVNEGVAYTFAPVASDSDAGDTTTFSIMNIPTWATFSSSTGVLTGTPTNSDVGVTSNIVITVTDTAGLTASLAAFSLTVVNVNDAPVISGTPITSVNEGVAYTFAPLASDSDAGDTTTFSINTTPSWATFSSSTGVLTGTPTNSDVGVTSNIVITVTDTAGLTASLAAFSLTVVNVNDAPVITGTPITSVAQDLAYTFIPLSTDSDVGDTATFSINTTPSWTTFNPSTGALTGTPTNSDVGTTSSIVITVTDTAGLTASLAAFSLEVTNVNDAPVITGTPAITIAQDAAYNFTPTVTDSDTNDTTTFSITNKPSWAVFSLTTGVLSGTPTSSDIGTTADIVITVTDSDNESVSLAAFSLEVTNVNDAPVITGTPITSVDVNADYSFIPTVTDADEDDIQQFTIVNKPGWATFDINTGELSGAPSEIYIGVTSDIIITTTDLQNESTSLDAFSIEVLALESSLEAVDDVYEFNRNDDNTYVLNVLSNDTDSENNTFSITASSTSIGDVTIDSDQLVLVVNDGFIGTVELNYSISNSNEEFSEATVSVVIAGDIDSLNVIIAPDDVEVNATGLYTSVELGVATATNSTGNSIAVNLVGNRLFTPGNNIAYWETADENAELNSTVSQNIIVHPLISLSKDQEVVEGSSAQVFVLLNGEAPTYPLAVPFSLSGNADVDDYIIAIDSIDVESGTEAVITISIVEDGIVEGDETLTITLGDVNKGNQSVHTITITEDNIAPSVDLALSQDDEFRQIITPVDGLVTINADVNDLNGDMVASQWIYGSDIIVVEETDNQLVFDPSNLTSGTYNVSLTVSEIVRSPLSSTDNVYFSVSNELVVLTTVDTDGDLIPDIQEGYKDSDEDGIPDYLDAISECNVIPQQVGDQNAFLVEGDAGICLRIGNTLAAGETGGVQLIESELEAFTGESDTANNIGGIFDYIATGLPVFGQDYNIVLPQRQPIPANALYRKYNAASGWQSFSEDADNKLRSTAGQAGYCPPPQSDLWTEGLTEGHWCVQLTIVDGGANDDDGIANGTIVDPGGVGVQASDNTAPVTVSDSARVRKDDLVIIDVLVNDIDAENDELTLGVVTATLGTVTITSDNQVEYQAATDFVGVDTVTYTISDGQGGTASGTITIEIFTNEAPIAFADDANTDDRTAITIDVLTNDTDSDNDVLSVLNANVDFGSVVVNSNSTLTFTPEFGFDGVATITYSITDGVNNATSADVSVQVTALETITVVNKSKGGSMGIMLFLIAAISAFRFKNKMNIKKCSSGLIAMLVGLCSFNASAEWFISAAVGESTAIERINTSDNNAVTSVDFDDKDTSFHIGVGYQYADYSLTIGYEQLGDTTANVIGDTLDAEQFQKSVIDVSPFLVDGISLGGQYNLWNNETFNLSAGLGILVWDLDYESHIQDEVVKVDDSGVDVFYKIQFDYAINKKVALNLQATHYDLLHNDVNNISVGVIYKFN